MSILEQLSEPFAPELIHWRVGATTKDKDKGIGLAYVNARDVMRRFDEVCGLDWQAEYPFEGCCRIGVKVDGEWVWRSNGAGETDVEGEKGRYSDAFKRAAVLWGVARYLYDLPNQWVALKAQGRSHVLAVNPKLPAWAMPKGVEREKAGNVSQKVIGPAETKAIKQMIESTGTDEQAFCKFLSVGKLAELPLDRYSKAMDALQAKADKNAS
jgi:hypothetical protein